MELDESRDWQSRVIVGQQLGSSELPPWAESSYRALHAQVIDDAYPCFFGVQAEKRGEMFYTFVPRGATQSLIESMVTFAALAKVPPYDRNNLAMFFEPDATPRSHEEYRGIFWRVLQSLHDADTHAEADHQRDPSDPSWEFCFQGVEMFVVCACPSFSRRRSRNLGPGMVLLFQPRSVFVDKITNKVIGLRARQQVRKRLLAWDAVEAHPDLGFFGDPGNLEWKQYFLPDDNQPNAGGCPFSRRQPKTTSSATLAVHEAQEGSFGDVHKPLSSAQEAMWFLWRLEPHSAAYNISAAIEIDGELDVETLRRALADVVERRSILRTRFAEMDGVARQYSDVSAMRAVDWSAQDLRRRAKPTLRARERLRARGNQAFDLTTGGLLRATLLQLEDMRSVLQLCTHQVVVDPWSLELLQREWLERYRAIVEARSDAPASLPIRVGQHELLTQASAAEPEYECQTLYWRSRLGSAPYVLELPTDRPHPARRATASMRLYQPVEPALSEGIRQLAAEHGVTPFVVMLSTFALLLQRYAGQSDIRVAVPLRRQAPPSDARSVGQCMNTVVIRLTVSSTELFGSLIEQAARYLSEAQVNGDLAFSRLVKSLRVDRSLAGTPLSQVLFSELPFVETVRQGGLHIQAFNDAIGRACYDLALNVATGADADHLYLDYSSTLFDESTVRRLLWHYLELLAQLTRMPSGRTQPMASLKLSHVPDPTAATSAAAA